MKIDPVFAPAHADLIYELESRGFDQVDEATWSGEVDTSVGPELVTIVFHEKYPVSPPKVKLQQELLDWHQNPDGSLCLWSDSEPGHFPWLQHGQLVARITHWIDSARDGWPDQTPDLDLERYWRHSGRYSLVIIPDSNMREGWLKFDAGADPKVLVYTGGQAPPARRSKSHRHRYGLVVSIGEPGRPLRDWEDLKELLPDSDLVENSIHSGRADLIIVQYSLDGHPGTFALARATGKSDKPQLEAVRTAADSQAVRRLRSGYLAPELSDKRVAVVGVGSVGSFVAEGLARTGVGTILLVDHGRLRPGHLPRHAANGPAGALKVVSTGLLISEYGCSVEPRATPLDNVDAARALLAECDLVVDATANETVTEMLRVAAIEANRQFACTFLMNDGRSMVADVYPAPSGEQLLPRRLPCLAPSMPESGCGDLVSPTAPYAVQEAALMAVRLAISMLCSDIAPSPQFREYTW